MITFAVWLVAVALFGLYALAAVDLDRFSTRVLWVAVVGIAAIPCACILATIAVNR